jgi:hypothetical protein
MRKLRAAELSNRRRALLPSLSSKASNGLGSSRAANSKAKRLPVSASMKRSD